MPEKQEPKRKSAIIGGMILVTGGTGFIGQALVRYLVSMGKPVRLLLRPSPSYPNLPKGVSVEAAVCSLNDERGLRAAMRGVDVVFHLVGAGRAGARSDLEGADIAGTLAVAQAASQAGIRHLLYLSHLGADRASAYPMLKAKGIAESYILRSKVNYTIFRSGVVYGPGDQFITRFARLLRISPGIFLMPGNGSTLLQPIWIEDLVTAMAWALEDEGMKNQIFSIGGPEYLSFREIMQMIQNKIHVHRIMVSFSQAYLRLLSLWIEQIDPSFPISIFWADYLAADRTCSLDTLPRLFGLIPARINRQLDYLL